MDLTSNFHLITKVQSATCNRLPLLCGKIVNNLSAVELMMAESVVFRTSTTSSNIFYNYASPPPQTKHCLNCHVIVGPGVKRYRMGRHEKMSHLQLIASYITKMFPTLTSKGNGFDFCATIPEALVYLFKLDMASIEPLLLNSLILCCECGQLLATLYVLHKEFDKLTSKVSFLSSQLEKFEGQDVEGSGQNGVSHAPITLASMALISTPMHEQNEFKEEILEEGDDQVMQVEMDFDSTFETLIEPQPLPLYNVNVKAPNPPNTKATSSSSRRKQPLVTRVDLDSVAPIPKKRRRRRKGELPPPPPPKPDKNYKCSLCAHQNGTLHAMREHIRKAHQPRHIPSLAAGQQLQFTDFFFCEVCQKLFVFFGHFDPIVEHFKNEHSIDTDDPRLSKLLPLPTIIQCSACEGKGGNSSLGSDFYGQQLTLTCAVHSTRFCEICGKTSFDPSYNKTHLTTHFGAEERERESCHLCDECGASFLNNASLRRHVSVTHGRKTRRLPETKLPDQYPFKCTKCDKAYKFGISLKNHFKSHESQHTCTFCHEVFDYLGFKEHKFFCKEQAEARPFKCNICHKFYGKAKSLRCHLLDVHRWTPEQTREYMYPDLKLTRFRGPNKVFRKKKFQI